MDILPERQEIFDGEIFFGKTLKKKTISKEFRIKMNSFMEKGILNRFDFSTEFRLEKISVDEYSSTYIFKGCQNDLFAAKYNRRLGVFCDLEKICVSEDSLNS